ncbi:MAG TPA: hypothetical protein DEP35_23405 [Deltaproteobacteria bacterium]|nr:hypothetical protein [Deltaproteobacteria bacterium]
MRRENEGDELSGESMSFWQGRSFVLPGGWYGHLYEHALTSVTEAGATLTLILDDAKRSE